MSAPIGADRGSTIGLVPRRNRRRSPGLGETARDHRSPRRGLTAGHEYPPARATLLPGFMDRPVARRAPPQDRPLVLEILPVVVNAFLERAGRSGRCRFRRRGGGSAGAVGQFSAIGNPGLGIGNGGGSSAGDGAGNVSRRAATLGSSAAAGRPTGRRSTRAASSTART